MSYHGRVVKGSRGSAPRRGVRGELVDCRGLASFVLRRCEGCSLEEHIETTKRFFAAQPGKFDAATQAEVLKLVKNHARTQRSSDGLGDGEVVNGSVICSTCGQRFYEHDLDEEYPWLTRVCGDRLVRVT